MKHLTIRITPDPKVGDIVTVGKKQWVVVSIIPQQNKENLYHLIENK